MSTKRKKPGYVVVKGSGGLSRIGEAKEPSWLATWFTEVAEVLERPSIAIAIFILGVIFIVLASKQVKLALDYMEKFGISERPRESVVGNFMALLVFFFIWLDIIILTRLKNMAISLGHLMQGWYQRALYILQNMDDDDNRQRKKF
ncbi:unnamed protein product [Lymnaea stagnalis]|uniref:Uncharacterized protein n=1 Tax=Lymnaea stagnalis TaxID=6523 RepID=A0AAV2IC40_LYMST